MGQNYAIRGQISEVDVSSGNEVGFMLVIEVLVPVADVPKIILFTCKEEYIWQSIII